MASGESRARAEAFCRSFGLEAPILLAPMAGACPPRLSAAVANAGGMGACGALLLSPDEIRGWADEFRRMSSKRFQINLWTADPDPARDAALESAVAAFLSRWTPTDPPGALARRDFDAQLAAAVAAGPDALSTIMGVLSPADARLVKNASIPWFATATTVEEARIACDAGADAIIAQGMEAGGHRGAFDDRRAADDLVGLVALVPAIADAVDLPVIAAGAVADGRGVAAALALGASAAMVGTAFLRCPEAGIAPAWREALERMRPEGSTLTRAFSGRTGRALRTSYVDAAAAPDAPPAAAFPVQRALTHAMRREGAQTDDLARMQAWAGQSAALGREAPAGDLVTELWRGAQEILS